MTLYVVEGVLDELIQLGCSTDKRVALFQAEQINKNGGIGYCHNEVFVTEYESDEDNWIEFD